MATLDISDLSRLALDYEELALLPDSVMDDALRAGGAVLRESVSREAASMLSGPYSKGAVAASATLTKPRVTKDGKAIYVTFEGSQHKTRIAEIAYINEYGKHNQAARQFVRTATEKCASEAVDAVEAIYNDYITRKGF